MAGGREVKADMTNLWARSIVSSMAHLLPVLPRALFMLSPENGLYVEIGGQTNSGGLIAV